MSEAQDDVATLFALGLGPWLFPLRGKIPAVDTWLDRPPVDEATVRGWLEIGFNLGLPCGVRSGVVVIDDDRVKHGEAPYAAPPTALQIATPTGGTHYYYAAPATQCPRNETASVAGKNEPHVDVRGEGGYVVVPPSIHPTARAGYRFGSVGKPSDWIFEAPKPPERRAAPPAPQRPSTGYADKALASEVHRVRTASVGARNDALNKSSFSLGQLVAGGVLDEGPVRSELLSAAMLVGLTEREATATISSGIKGGAKSPRTVPEREERRAATTPTRPAVKPEILIPGSHVLPGGEYIEQGTNDFAHAVLSALKPDSLYRRADALGEIIADEFKPTPPHGLRAVVDGSMRLISSAMKDDEPTVTFRTCSIDLARLISEYGSTHGQVRVLKHLASHPVVLAPDFIPAAPGWNADHGVYLTVDSVPAALDLPTAKAVLDDLVADFPFQDAADLANFLGLLLTPIIRPAINEPVPMHLIASPMERTGKTKLAEVVLGVSITGKRTPAMQLGEREEEREKRILSVLIRGQGLLHLDNLSDFLDSPSLASLLTSSEYQGRILGSSSSPTLPNGLTVVGTGNNVHASGEIAKRIVPIRLLPASGTPERRTDFRHPDLLAFVTTSRERTIGALLGLIENWKAKGRPLWSGGFGGFERWSAVVGGILNAAGYNQWLTNLPEWLGKVDDTGQEHDEFVTVWARGGTPETPIPPGCWVSTATLYKLSVDLGLFAFLERSKNDHGKRIMFGGKVLNKLHGRVCGQFRVEVDGVGARRQARLSPLQ